MRQVAKLLMVALFATAVWTTNAQAAPAWYTCDVTQVGLPLENILSIRVSGIATDPTTVPQTFPAQWLVGNSVTANAMLAVALTAISLDAALVCRVDVTLSPPEVFRLFLKK